MKSTSYRAERSRRAVAVAILVVQLAPTASLADDVLPFRTQIIASQLVNGTVVRGRAVPTWSVADPSSPVELGLLASLTNPSAGNVGTGSTDPSNATWWPPAAERAAKAAKLQPPPTPDPRSAPRPAPAPPAPPTASAQEAARGAAATAHWQAVGALTQPSSGTAVWPAYPVPASQPAEPTTAAVTAKAPAARHDTLPTILALADRGTVSDAASRAVSPPPPSAAVQSLFSIDPGERLSAALLTFIQANGMRMQWNARTDFVIQHPYRVERGTFKDTLRDVLAAYGLGATLWEGNGVVEIYARNGDLQ